MVMAEKSNASDLVDVRRAAALAGCHPETVRRWVWSGRLAARRRGNRLLVARDDVEALAEDKTRTVISLATWAERARAATQDDGESPRRRSAADLVIEDRAHRSRSTISGARR
jgi:excisionase family DNA binding protein